MAWKETSTAFLLPGLLRCDVGVVGRRCDTVMLVPSVMHLASRSGNLWPTQLVSGTFPGNHRIFAGGNHDHIDSGIGAQATDRSQNVIFALSAIVPRICLAPPKLL